MRQDEATLIRTSAGLIDGRREGRLLAWRGVPFAAPPVGRLRLRAPQAVTPWPGVRDATRDGAVPPQPRSTRLTGAAWDTPMDEDCLSLTVLRRAAAAGPLPVMVFVHGGAYGVGGADAAAYRGESMAARGDVVFVGFNYRLGALGWMDFGAYGTTDRPIDGNLGLRDQLAALTWVQREIAAFGGDPERITLFGESAGATSVAALLAMPAARGLFRGAILQSAAAGGVVGRQTARRWADELIASLPGGLDDLLTGDVDALVSATMRLDAAVSDAEPAARVLGPVVDGDLLPDYPLDVLGHGGGAPVPLVVGTNRDEGTLFQLIRSIRATPERLDRLFELTVPDSREGVLAAYPKRRRLTRLVTDLIFWHPSTVLAAGHSTVAPVWMYRFDFTTRMLRLSGLGAMHGAELDHVFGRLHSATRRVALLLGGRRRARALTARMSEAWTGFARTGAMPASWPRFDAEHRRTMVFDTADRVVSDPDVHARRAWEPWRSYR